MANVLTISSDTIPLFGARIPSGVFSGDSTTTYLFTDRFIDRLYLGSITETGFDGQILSDVRGEVFSEVHTLFGFNGLVGTVGSFNVFADTTIKIFNLTIYGSISFNEDSVVLFSGQSAYDGTFSLSIDSITKLSGTISDPISGVLDSVVNTVVLNQRTTGVSEYTKYNFNSFFALGGIYYGVASDGIYLLDGNTDGTVSIAQSKITTGVSDFETQKLKAVRDGYAYIRSSGDMTVQLTTNEQTQRTDYPLYYDNIDGIHRRRVKTAQGIRGTSWQAEIRNEDGADFTIKQLDLIPRELDRSI